MFETFISLLLSFSVTAQGMMFPFSFWKTTAGASSGIIDATCSATSTLTTDGDYNICDFVAGGNSAGGATVFIINSGTGTVRRLVIGSGGGGGMGTGGPGGAGGFQDISSTYGPGTYAVSVGAVGVRAANSTTIGTQGGNSIFDADTSIGGGYGTGGSAVVGAGNGGSGGGGASGGPGAMNNKGLGTAGQGHDGGTGDGNNGTAAGGGGCGSVGADGTASGNGDGGTGCNSDIFNAGVNICYAGGGSTGAANATCGGGRNSGSIPVQGKGGGGWGGAAGATLGGNGSLGRVAIRWKAR